MILSAKLLPAFCLVNQVQIERHFNSLRQQKSLPNEPEGFLKFMA
jgi:hypothetical protein